jgi:hypothetical protein
MLASWSLALRFLAVCVYHFLRLDNAITTHEDQVRPRTSSVLVANRILAPLALVDPPGPRSTHVTSILLGYALTLKNLL